MSSEKTYRYDVLRTLLIWEGRLNNARLREVLNTGVTRTSQLIRAFREDHPAWMEWNTVTRSYHVTPAAYRSSFDASVMLAKYLSLVELPHATSDSPKRQGLWNAFPDMSVPAPQTFALLSEAIETSRRIQMSYCSMGNPKPHKREISPHSLVRAGRRWHVRGFCADKQEFRDYVLGRIENLKILEKKSERNSVDDNAWNTVLDVRLIAHPALSLDQQEVVCLEYFSKTSARVDRCRAALLSYFIQDLRAATDVKRQLPPEYQLAVENMEELRQWTFDR